MNEFTQEDLHYLSEKGISQEKVLAQIRTFKEGIPPVRLKRAAVVGDGILKFSEAEQDHLIGLFSDRQKGLEILKFIPASGAASRMFKALFGFINAFDPDRDSLEVFLGQPKQKAVRAFYEGLQRFPFYGLIRSRLGEAPGSEGAAFYEFVREMLTEEGLNYGFYPKGLLPFHKYEKGLATPFEEHLKEAAAYARSGKTARLHFTISPQHRALFDSEYERVGARMQEELDCDFEVSYSYQKASTDTLAVTPDNLPFRDQDGQLLFRPGGHGALIENLNEQAADLLFIKNIDNVVPDRSMSTIADWKKVLGGYLLELQDQTFGYARMLHDGTLDHHLLKRIQEFLEESLNVRFPQAYSGYSLDEQIGVLKDKLARPIRVCGMVKNEGEPGGGPFWITDSQGHESLQIVESAQVETGREDQRRIFQDATHFNPVDIVCGVRDAFGLKYNLINYVDADQGFITEKTFEGRPLKALELPGLWNGGMAYWNTVFVEVPISTFNPVKTVNDLLKPSHQPQ